jgi:serine/threonine-protein kinase
LADIADVRLEIDEALSGRTEADAALPVKSRTYGLAVAAAIIATALLTVIAQRLLTPGHVSQVRRFAVLLEENEQFSGSPGRAVLALAPDAAHLAYTANQRLNLRSLAKLETTAVPGTNQAVSPFFSPDGEWIGFWQTGQLKKVSVSGGPPVALCEWAIPFSAAWEADGTILFSKGRDGIWRVPDGGGQPTQVIKLDRAKDESAEMPQALPKRDIVLFTLTSGDTVQSSQGRALTAQIVAQSVTSGERTVLVNGATGGRYLSTGHLLYMREGTLLAQPFDVDRLVTSGNPVPLIEGVSGSRAQGGVTAAGFGAAALYSVSRDGVLAYVPVIKASSERTLVWVDRQGKETPIPAPARAYVYPRISPDGSRIVVDARDQDVDIHIWDLARQTLTRLTFDPNADIAPEWTPDGKRVLFGASRLGVAWRAADGTGSVEQLTTQGNTLHSPTGLSPDGKTLLMNESTAGFDMKLVHLDGKREVMAILQSPSKASGQPATLVGNAVFSPDGTAIAYQSNESGQDNIYVRPFPDVQNGRWQISSDGGTRPAWSRSGEIFYLMPGGTVMAVPMRTAKGIQPGNPVKLFSGPYYTALFGRTYDVTPDGRRFLMVKTTSQTVTETARIIVVENWFEELKRKVPVK